MTEQNRFEINWTRSAGSALGAVSSAVLLSTLGVAGTLIGAALGSLVITVGGAIYSTSLEATKKRVLKNPARTDRDGNGTRDDLVGNGTRDDLVGNGTRDELAGNGERTDRAPGGAADVPAWQDTWAPLPVEEEAAADTPWGERLRDLPWKRITGASVAVFGIAMALILAFEWSTGRPVSSYTGGTSSTQTGTSIPGFDGRRSPGTGTEPDQQDPQQQDAPQEDAPQEEVPQEEVPQDAPQQEEVPQEPQPEAPQPQQAPPAEPAQ